MSLLNDLITTVGLDRTFFYQLFLAVILYFVSKKLFFQPYLKNFEKSEESAKGRLAGVRQLEEEIEKQKLLYEEQARRVHQKFQDRFLAIKHEAQKDFEKKSLKIRKEQKEHVKKERQALLRDMEKQSLFMEIAFPSLARLLVEKIKS